MPLGLLAGMSRQGNVDEQQLLRVSIELQPKETGLDALAAQIADPGNAMHRSPLTRDAFEARFRRSPREITSLARFLHSSGAADLYTSRSGLVVAGIFSVAQIERAFSTTFGRFALGDRIAVAPIRPLTVPFSGVRAVRGTVAITTPRLADVPVSPNFTYFRGNWYPPDVFRQSYDAVLNGGRGERITLIEDASDRADPADFELFTSGPGSPSGASPENVEEHSFAFKAPSSSCGRDDRGQEPTLDVDAVFTLAPRAKINLDYDDVCSYGNDGTLALQRALDATDPPTEIVFPFTVGNVNGTIAQSFGSTPIPLLEAAVLGVPVIAPAGDDGAYGMRLPGQSAAAVTYPCALPLVICAGGTQLGDRDTTIDEALWNDGINAGGGGISAEPRPSWQDAPGGFEFSIGYAAAKHRIIPDVSADASGHLRIFWKGYGSGGVGGTSESAALVGAQLAAINGAVPPAHRLAAPGDLYALARAAPGAYRDVARENDRGYNTNTLHLPPKPRPLGYRGIIATPPPLANGCGAIQQNGCQVRPGYDAVTGIGSLKEQAAIDALR